MVEAQGKVRGGWLGTWPHRKSFKVSSLGILSCRQVRKLHTYRLLGEANMPISPQAISLLLYFTRWHWIGEPDHFHWQLNKYEVFFWPEENPTGKPHNPHSDQHSSLFSCLLPFQLLPTMLASTTGNGTFYIFFPAGRTTKWPCARPAGQRWIGGLLEPVGARLDRQYSFCANRRHWIIW